MRRLLGWIDEYLTHIASERGLSANTVAAYRRDLGTWARFCATSNLDPANINPDDLTEFLARLRAGKAPASGQKLRDVIRVDVRRVEVRRRG